MTDQQVKVYSRAGTNPNEKLLIGNARFRHVSRLDSGAEGKDVLNL
jgi:hypothetical protein